jgi:hypothetical protein
MADGGTFNTTSRTVAFACLTAHMRKTITTLCCAVVAGSDAVIRGLIEMIIHGVSPCTDFEKQSLLRKNSYPLYIGC